MFTRILIGGMFLSCAMTTAVIAQSGQSPQRFAPVLGACGAGSSDCADAVDEYLNSVRAGNVDDAAIQQEIADLVVALATSQQDGTCGGNDAAAADGIASAASFSPSAQQQAQISDIATAVRVCQEVQVAAIEEDGISAAAGGDQSSPN